MTAEDAAQSLRVDKWLWHARFFKTRSLAARAVTGQGLRVNGQRVTKASAAVRPGDVLTFAQGEHIKVAKIVALGTRRGPAPEAQALYEDLSPPVLPRAERAMSAPTRPKGAGRPTKAERRAIDELKGEG
jgi:ribosome-associated heat shock protein Hsp15